MNSFIALNVSELSIVNKSIGLAVFPFCGTKKWICDRLTSLVKNLCENIAFLYEVFWSISCLLVYLFVYQNYYVTVL